MIHGPRRRTSCDGPGRGEGGSHGSVRDLALDVGSEGRGTPRLCLRGFNRRHDPERREAWLRDQYQHPEEHRHTIAEVQRWFAENQIEFLRTYPSAVFDDVSDELFTKAEDNWRLESWLTQLGWMFTLGREGGLFYTIGRRL